MFNCKSYVQLLVMTLFLMGLSSTSFGLDDQNNVDVPTFIFDDIDGIPMGDTNPMGIRLYEPDNIPAGKKLGLILGFHPHGGNIHGMRWPALLLPNPKWVQDADTGQYYYAGNEDYIFIGLKSVNAGYVDNNGDWEAVDVARVKWVMDWALANYPIDPRRVHAIGHSRGAFMATRFALEYPNDIASVYAVAGAHSDDWTVETRLGFGSLPDGETYDYNFDFSNYTSGDLPEFYHIHGVNDGVIDVHLTRSFTRELALQGAPFVYREMKDGDHGNVFGSAGEYGANAQDGMDFLHATRNENFPITAEQQAVLDSIPGLLPSMRYNAETRAIIQEVIRIGGSEAGEALLPVLGYTANWGVRALVAEEAIRAKLGPSFTAALGEIAANEALPEDQAYLRTVVYNVLSQYAKWRQADALAQIWPLDIDGDGNPFGIEHTLGTDPLVSDREHTNNLSIVFAAGEVRLSLRPVALDYASWRLARSLDLGTGSFEQILRFDGSTQQFDPPAPGIIVLHDLDLITIIDQNPPDPRAYYRFEAELLGP